LLTAWEPDSMGDEFWKWFIKVIGKPVTEEKLVNEVKFALA
jgi:hypothetical protein